MILLRHSLLLVFILTNFKSSAQAEKDSLRTKILAAEKVEILSHQDLHLRSTFEEMKNGINGYWRRIVDSNGHLNDCIVVENVILSKTGVDSLIGVLCKEYYSEIPVDKAACFLPHQTIIMYSKGQCSFVDICFDCHRFSSSDDIIFPAIFLSADEQWHELKRFFIANGIKYKVASESTE